MQLVGTILLVLITIGGGWLAYYRRWEVREAGLELLPSRVCLQVKYAPGANDGNIRAMQAHAQVAAQLADDPPTWTYALGLENPTDTSATLRTYIHCAPQQRDYIEGLYSSLLGKEAAFFDVDPTDDWTREVHGGLEVERGFLDRLCLATRLRLRGSAAMAP